MIRDELKAQIDELMRQYTNEKIDEATYVKKMMVLTAFTRDEYDN